MVHTLYATYDGHVLMPEGAVDLLPNHRNLIQIESQQQPEPKKNVLQRLSEKAMDLGVSDLASQHEQTGLKYIASEQVYHAQ